MGKEWDSTQWCVVTLRSVAKSEVRSLRADVGDM